MKLRQQRLADEIRDILALCFQGGRMHDPRLENVTITGVKLSADLQIASVYFRVYFNKGVKGALDGLEHAKGFLKQRLSEHLDIRRTPQLRFFYDESIERGARIESLIQQIHSQG